MKVECIIDAPCKFVGDGGLLMAAASGVNGFDIGMVPVGDLAPLLHPVSKPELPYLILFTIT